MIKAAIITVSDTRTADNDLSGDKLGELLNGFGAKIIERVIVADDQKELERELLSLSDREDVNLILTTGGTGFALRDVTPEATRAVIQRQAPGLAEAMRRETSAKTPMAMLSRGVCGIRGSTLIINLPGSPKAVAECFEIIRPVLRHAIELISGVTQYNDPHI